MYGLGHVWQHHGCKHTHTKCPRSWEHTRVPWAHMVGIHDAHSPRCAHIHVPSSAAWCPQAHTSPLGTRNGNTMIMSTGVRVAMSRGTDVSLGAHVPILGHTGVHSPRAHTCPCPQGHKCPRTHSPGHTRAHVPRCAHAAGHPPHQHPPTRGHTPIPVPIPVPSPMLGVTMVKGLR